MNRQDLFEEIGRQKGKLPKKDWVMINEIYVNPDRERAYFITSSIYDLANYIIKVIISGAERVIQNNGKIFDFTVTRKNRKGNIELRENLKIKLNINGFLTREQKNKSGIFEVNDEYDIRKWEFIQVGEIRGEKLKSSLFLIQDALPFLVYRLFSVYSTTTIFTLDDMITSGHDLLKHWDKQIKKKTEKTIKLRQGNNSEYLSAIPKDIEMAKKRGRLFKSALRQTATNIRKYIVSALPANGSEWGLFYEIANELSKLSERRDEEVGGAYGRRRQGIYDRYSSLKYAFNEKDANTRKVIQTGLGYLTSLDNYYYKLYELNKKQG